jgi:ketosteroid isomerase-like protein
MSEENVDLVKQSYEHFARTRELDVTAYGPEVEWHSAADDPGLEVFRGVEGVKELIAEVQVQLEDFRTEPFEFLDAGDRVVAGLVHKGRGRGSSAEVEMREWNVFLIRAGKIVAVHEYRNREEAIEAAGLSD